MNSILDQIADRFGVQLSSRARSAVLYAFTPPLADLDDLIDRLTNDFGRAELQLLRCPGVGRKSINEILQVLQIRKEPRELKTAIVQAVYDDRVLSKDDVRLIRKLMSAYMSISEEGEVADHIRDLRERLPL